jgi:hypothetical protein
MMNLTLTELSPCIRRVQRDVSAVEVAYKQANFSAPVRERPPLVFADRRCYVIRVMDPYGRIVGFIDQSRCYFFQVAPQLYSRG